MDQGDAFAQRDPPPSTHRYPSAPSHPCPTSIQISAPAFQLNDAFSGAASALQHSGHILMGNERHDQADVTAGPAPAGVWEQLGIALAPCVLSADFNAPLQRVWGRPEWRRKQRRWQGQ